jgi:hypothetical protein
MLKACKQYTNIFVFELTLTINPMELAEAIRNTIEAKLCPVHDIRPHVEIIGNEITIACCCTAFQEECIKEAQMLFDQNNQTDSWIFA